MDASGAVNAGSAESAGHGQSDHIPNRLRVQGTIVALGGGGFSMSEDGSSGIDDRLLELAAKARVKRSGTMPEPASGAGPVRVCFIPTASGDSSEYIRRFEAAFAGRAETHVLSLFGQSPWDYENPTMLLDMDLIYVGGGSTANLLSLWRLHGLDETLRQAAAEGIILAGISAGANCWFDASSTDSFGDLAPLNDGLGFISGSVCPHYHGEPGRVETFDEWIGTGQLPGPGLGIDDHAAVVFTSDRTAAGSGSSTAAGTTTTSVMVEDPGAGAFDVSGSDGR